MPDTLSPSLNASLGCLATVKCGGQEVHEEMAEVEEVSREDSYFRRPFLV